MKLCSWLFIFLIGLLSDALGAESSCPSDSALANLADFKCEAELIRQSCHDFAREDESIKDLIKTCPDKLTSLAEDFAAGCASGLGGAWQSTYEVFVRDPFVFLTQTSVATTKRYLEECSQSQDCKEALFYETHLREPSEKERIKLEKMHGFAELDVFYRNAMQVYNSNGQQNIRFAKKVENLKAKSDISSSGKSNSSVWQSIKALIDRKTDKFSCLNREGRALMVCYAVFSILDPSLVVGGGAAALKFTKINAILKNVKPTKATTKIEQVTGEINKASNKGLSLDGKRLIGAADGSEVAQVVQNIYDKQGVKVVVDDTKFVNKPQTVLITQEAYANTLYVRSNFIDKPDLGGLLHEVKHISSERKKIATRLIEFSVTDSKQVNPAMKSYSRTSRFDEVEARLGQANMNRMSGRPKSADIILKDANLILQDQKKISQTALDALSKDDAITLFTQDAKGNKVIEVHFQMNTSVANQHQGMTLRIPYSGGYATDQAYTDYATKILQQRLKELEVLEKGRLLNTK